jgi:hypothetical protein
MDELHDLVEKCTAATRRQQGDLISLAQLHSDLQSIRDLLAHRPAVVSAAQEAAELVEKIVLGKSQDSAAELRQIESAVARLQSLIRTKPMNGDLRTRET